MSDTINTTKLRMLAVAGSLRQASLHRALLRSLQELAPSDVEIVMFDLKGMPIYDGDVEVQGMPDIVQAFHQEIEAADGVIWATPEYNGAMSGVIKNAVDWASRKKGLLAKKPTTVISGSPGSLGATKGQESLRASLNHLGMYVLARPSLAIPQLDKKLRDDHIIDESTQKFVRDWLQSFQDWIVQLNK
ncbi:MAG: NAD(P)H-dependent oxidoreductase [Deinococcota bacterium]